MCQAHDPEDTVVLSLVPMRFSLLRKPEVHTKRLCEVLLAVMDISGSYAFLQGHLTLTGVRGGFPEEVASE